MSKRMMKGLAERNKMTYDQFAQHSREWASTF